MVLGASAVLSNGTVIARCGAAAVAMLAASRERPVLVAAETYKFGERVQLDSFTSNELGDPDALAAVPLRPELTALQGWRAQPCLGAPAQAGDCLLSSLVAFHSAQGILGLPGIARLQAAHHAACLLIMCPAQKEGLRILACACKLSCICNRRKPLFMRGSGGRCLRSVMADACPLCARRPAEPDVRRYAGRLCDAHRDRVWRHPAHLRARDPARIPAGAGAVGAR